MMSLSQVNLNEIVKHQYQFKMKSYLELFNPLIFMQLIALLFSLGGIASGSKGVGLTIQYYTVDYVIVFTMIWAFIIAIQVTSKDYREQTIPFVTNRLTESISNILFILTASIVGGLLALLSRFLLIAVIRFVFNFKQIFGMEMTMTFTEMLTGIVATTLYIFLFGTLGYLVGILVQRNKVFAGIIPAFALGLLFYYAQIGGAATDNFINNIFVFYFQEKVFLLFFLKIIITSALLYIGAYLISSRLEVR